MVFVSWGFVNSCARKLLNKAAIKLNNFCDPAPLLQEVNEQLAYSRSKTYNQILLINKCVAWREMGQFDQALQTLEHLNIDQYSGTLPQTKVVYYNNLADAFIEMKDAEKAMLWLSKASQIAADLKNRKLKMILQDSLLWNYAGIANLRGQYDEAEQLLLQNTGKVKPLRRKVSEAILLADIYANQGKHDSALQQLNFVITNGNKVFDVQKAQKMMDIL